MIIAVASGKGGTGKTTVAVAMAKALEDNARLLDCDVEEPNAHIFMKPQNIKESRVTVPVPVIDETKCTLCGRCGAVCEFNAIAVLKTEVMVFGELCHSCGGCVLACDAGAVSEKDKEIATVSAGQSGAVKTVEGKIDVGKALVPPVIRAVKKYIEKDAVNILDCPPGTACPAVTAMNGADYIVLVTEATPFGLHDLKLAVDVVRELEIPHGVIINRWDTGDTGVENYCSDEKINILLKIPESMEVAKAYSKGETLISAMPEMKKEFLKIIDLILRGAA
jgi:MinD superfamily P-loop ATPase